MSPIVTTTYKTLRVKYTHYGDWIYYASFAVSFGYRAIPTTDKNCRIVRLWLDSVLVYDAYANVGSLNWVFYPGAEDQPFYRGQMVLFFGHLAIADSGGIPAVTAEIVDDTALGSETGALYVGRHISPLGASDLYGNAIIQAVPEGTRTLFRAINLDTHTESLSAYHAALLDTTSPVVFAPWLQLALFNDAAGPTLVSYTPSAAGIGGIFGSSPDVGYSGFPAFNMGLAQNCGNHLSVNSTFFFLASAQAAGVWPYMILYAYNGSPIYAAGVGLSWMDEPVCFARGVRSGGAPLASTLKWGQPGAEDYGDVLVAFPYSVRRVRVGPQGSNPQPRGTGPDHPELAPTVDDAGIYTHDPSVGTISRIISYNMLGALSEASNPIILLIETDHALHRGFARKIGYDGTIIWDSATFDLDFMSSKQFATVSGSADLTTGRLAVPSWHVVGAYTQIDLATGSLTAGTYDHSIVTIDPTRPAFYSSTKDGFYPDTDDQHYVHINLPGATAIPLPDAISLMAQRAGFAPDKITVNGLDDTIIGYVIGSQVTLEDILDNLAAVYQFTYAEIGDQLIVQSIFDDDGSFLSSITIPEADLAVLQEGQTGTQQIISAVIGDQSKAPAQISVRYIDPDLDFQTNVQTAKRIQAPLPTVQSDATTLFDIPIVASGGTMLALCYRALYAVWAAQNSSTIRLPQKYAALIPTDGFIFTALGEDHAVTAVQVTLNADFSISLSTVERLPVSVLPAVSTQTPTRPAARGPVAPARALLLDIPDTSPGMEADKVLNLGVAVSGYAADKFLSARLDTTVVSSAAGWGTKYTTSTEVPVGQVIAVAGDRSHLGTFETDTATTITFALGPIAADAFSDATYLAMLAGANQLVIGRDARYEIIRFQNWTDNGDGTVTIDTLMRGCYGTDPVIGMTTVGDFVVPYDALAFIAYSDDDFLNRVAYAYRAVVPGENAEDAEQGFILPQAIAKRPWAPAHIEAKRMEDGSIDIWLDRRERFNAALLDGTGDIPVTIGRTFSVDLYYGDMHAIYLRTPPTSNFDADGYDHIVLDATAVAAAGYAADTRSINVYVYQHDPVLGRGWGADGIGVGITDFDGPPVPPVEEIDAVVAASMKPLASSISILDTDLMTVVSGSMKKMGMSASIADGTPVVVLVGAMGHVGATATVVLGDKAIVNGAMQKVASSIAVNSGSGEEGLTFGGDHLLFDGETIGFS